jgi:hypothetical protein
MKKYFWLFLFLTTSAFAQNNVSQSDDWGRIALHTYLSDNGLTQMPPAAKNYLATQLSKIATQNGLGGSAQNPQFIITAEPTVIDKNVTSSVPAMIVLNLDISIFIEDFQSKTKYSSVSVSAKGVGQNETKAYVNAIKQINPNTPAIKQFVDVGKTKIIEYYNSQCDFVIKDAERAVAQNNYEAAILKLAAVPSVCKDCYFKASNAVAPIYKKYIDRNGVKYLQNARNAFAAQPNSIGADSAAKNLALIDPSATCWSEAKVFSDSIRTKMMVNEKRQWDFMMRQYDVSQDVNKQKLDSFKEAVTTMSQRNWQKKEEKH